MTKGKNKKMPKIGERQIRYCKETKCKVEKEYIGKNQDCDSPDGWLCLHKGGEENIEIKVAHPKTDIDELRRTLAIPDKYPDVSLLEAFVMLSLDNFMNVEHLDPEDVQEFLTNGVSIERYL